MKFMMMIIMLMLFAELISSLPLHLEFGEVAATWFWGRPGGVIVNEMVIMKNEQLQTCKRVSMASKRL